MTLKEYLMDYASPSTREKGERMIRETIPLIPSERVRQLTVDHLAAISEGRRDFRF